MAQAVACFPLALIVLLACLPATPQGDTLSATNQIRQGHSLLQASQSVTVSKVSVNEAHSCTDGTRAASDQLRTSSAKAAANEFSATSSVWFFALEFVLGAVTAKFLLKVLKGKGDPDAKAKQTTQAAMSSLWSTKEAGSGGAAKGDCVEKPIAAPKPKLATLADAARVGDAAEVTTLLKAGAKVNAEDFWGCTALHVAANQGHIDVARALLAGGADVNAREAWDETALHFAARAAGGADLCELLLAHGANIDALNADDVTPLLAAAHANREAACQVLLARGAGAGGASDGELPPLLQKLLLLRCLAPAAGG